MSIQKQENLVEIEAREKFYRRRLVDISRIKLLPNKDIGQIDHFRMGTNHAVSNPGRDST